MPQPTRRSPLRFMLLGLGVSGGALGLSYGRALEAAMDRPYAAAAFGLTLDGVKAGLLKSADGGGVAADVVQGSAGPGGTIEKHLGAPRFEEWVLEVGFDGPAALHGWIAGSWQGSAQRKSGAISECNANYDVVAEHEFMNALITETSFPAMDAASREGGYMKVKLEPEQARKVQGSGKCSAAVTKGGSKLWQPSNFRLELPGIDTTGVRKIDTFSVKQRVSSSSAGRVRDFGKEPGKLEFPNLKITVASNKAKTFEDWFDDFVIKGNNGAGEEKSGAIVLLGPNLAEEIARIDLRNVGIYRLARSKAEAGGAASLTVELYVEGMALKVGKTSAAMMRRAPAPRAPATKGRPKPAKRRK